MREKRKRSLGQRILTIIAIILFVAVLPLLVINAVGVSQVLFAGERQPSYFGYTPLALGEDVEIPNFENGDVAFFKTVEQAELEAGDIIAFYADDSHMTSPILHRIVSTSVEDGEVVYETQGDRTRTSDNITVEYDSIIGEYAFTMYDAGGFISFVTSVSGILLWGVLPIVIFLLYCGLRRGRTRKVKKAKSAATNNDGIDFINAEDSAFDNVNNGTGVNYSTAGSGNQQTNDTEQNEEETEQEKIEVEKCSDDAEQGNKTDENDNKKTTDNIKVIDI